MGSSILFPLTPSGFVTGSGYGSQSVNKFAYFLVHRIVNFFIGAKNIYDRTVIY
jgi:hypothetical protein